MTPHALAMIFGLAILLYLPARVLGFADAPESESGDAIMIGLSATCWAVVISALISAITHRNDDDN